MLAHWATFTAYWRERCEGSALPAFVTKTVEPYEMPSDDLCDREPALAEILSGSLTGTVATGSRHGMTQMRMGFSDGDPSQKRLPPLCADAEGYNLHAGVRVAANDAQRRERVLRYLLRGPLAEDRLRELDSGRIALTLRKPLRDGTTHLVFEPLELIERLIALIPWPRAHQIRYHGLLAPHAKLRPQIVATAHSATAHVPQGATAADAQEPRDESPSAQSRRRSWAQLLRHVFQIDILACPRCGARMKIIAAIRNPEALVTILRYLDLPIEPPTPAPARSPPQPSLFPNRAAGDAWPEPATRCDGPFSENPA